MKKIILSSFAASVLLTALSCKTEFDTDVKDVKVTNGNADFSKYVSIGNSLTSGYRDGALYQDGQKESFPSMIAQQMALAGGGSFAQPLMSDNLGGIPAIGVTNKLVLTSTLGIENAAGTATNTIANTYGSTTINNMGVPGAKSYHLVAPGYGNPANLSVGRANPYFVRFAKTPASSSVLSDAMTTRPTFFSLWIGNNDVLSYATSGGEGVNRTGNADATTYGSNDISDPTLVAGVIRNVLDGLKSVGSTKGVIANIPYVTSIPFFTTVPHNPLTPSLLGSNITALNTNLYGPLKQALSAFGAGSRINLLSSTSANPVLIKDTSLTNLSAQLTAALTPALGATTAAAFGQIYGQARQATAEDFILLTTRSVIGTTAPGAPASISAYGISFPLETRHVLTKTEATSVKTAVDAYNAAIAQLANSYGIALVDANTKMNELSSTSGIQYNGVKYTASFVTGGSFSLDGVHPTGRGYAIIANAFIDAINSKYQSTLPHVDVNKYSGVTIPK